MDIQKQLLREWRDAWWKNAEDILLKRGVITEIVPRQNIPTHLNIVCEFVNTYPNYRWNTYIQSYLIASIDDIMQCPNLLDGFNRHNWMKISERQDVTEDIITKYPNAHWNYKTLTKNKNISMQYILNNPNRGWDWGYMSSHQNVTMDIVTAYPNVPWVMKDLLENPNITTRFVKKMFPNEPLQVNVLNMCFKDMEYYNEWQTTQILIMTIYETYSNIKPNCQLAKIEYILADEYLAKLICSNRIVFTNYSPFFTKN